MFKFKSRSDFLLKVRKSGIRLTAQYYGVKPGTVKDWLRQFGQKVEDYKQ